VKLEDLNPVQKSAVVMIALGIDNASNILKTLDENDVEQITAEIAKMRHVPAETMNAILEEYYQMIKTNHYIVQGGITYAKKILEKAWGIRKADEVLTKIKMRTDLSAFHLLQSVDNKQILNFLQKEHPQTTAIILANMRPEQAASILSELPEEYQYEIAYRLATMEKISPDVIADIEDVIKQQMGTFLNSNLSQSGGTESVAEILNSLGPASEENILSNLKERDAALASEIHELMFVFEDIKKLPDFYIQRILKEVNSKVFALALKGSSPALRERIYQNMTERAANMLSEEVKYLGIVKLRDVKNAQKKIVDTIRKLDSAGEISILRQAEQFVE